LAFVLLAGILFSWLALNRWGVLGKIFVILAICIVAMVTHVYIVITANSPIEYLTEQVFSATGKSSTFSGRVYLWKLLFSEIARHPWFGIGYGGFWTGIEGASGMVIRQLNWGPPTQSHSGYIDVANELGFIGLALLALLLLSQLRNLIRLYRSGENEFSLFHSAILFCTIVINYAETSFLRTTHLWWIVFCISIIEVNVRIANNSFKLPRDFLEDEK
jgi:O-antigen ligase